MEIGEFEKEMSNSGKIMRGEIAGCFTTDDSKNDTKRGLCLPSSVSFKVIIK